MRRRWRALGWPVIAPEDREEVAARLREARQMASRGCCAHRPIGMADTATDCALKEPRDDAECARGLESTWPG